VRRHTVVHTYRHWVNLYEYYIIYIYILLFCIRHTTRRVFSYAARVQHFSNKSDGVCCSCLIPQIRRTVIADRRNTRRSYIIILYTCTI